MCQNLQSGTIDENDIAEKNKDFSVKSILDYKNDHRDGYLMESDFKYKTQRHEKNQIISFSSMGKINQNKKRSGFNYGEQIKKHTGKNILDQTNKQRFFRIVEFCVFLEKAWIESQKTKILPIRTTRMAGKNFSS